MNKEIMQLESPLDLMESFFSGDPWAGLLGHPSLSGGSCGWAPQVDIRETKDAVIIDAALPGVKKEDVDVSVKDGRLILSGKTKRELNQEEGGWVRRELSAGQFYRAFELPSEVKSESVKAKFEDGVLQVSIPKAESAKPRQIDVE